MAVEPRAYSWVVESGSEAGSSASGSSSPADFFAPTATGSLSSSFFFAGRLRGLTIFRLSGRSSSSPDSSRSTSTVVPETIESGPWRRTSSASGSSM